MPAFTPKNDTVQPGPDYPGISVNLHQAEQSLPQGLTKYFDIQPYINQTPAACLLGCVMSMARTQGIVQNEITISTDAQNKGLLDKGGFYTTTPEQQARLHDFVDEWFNLSIDFSQVNDLAKPQHLVTSLKANKVVLLLLPLPRGLAHWVAVYGIHKTPDGIDYNVMDPSYGKRNYSHDQMARALAGIQDAGTQLATVSLIQDQNNVLAQPKLFRPKTMVSPPLPHTTQEGNQFFRPKPKK